MSLRKSIDAKCKDCIYDELAHGNWRQQVEACTSPECGLYDCRPRSRGMARVEHLIVKTGADAQRDGYASEGRDDSARA